MIRLFICHGAVVLRPVSGSKSIKVKIFEITSHFVYSYSIYRFCSFPNGNNRLKSFELYWACVYAEKIKYFIEFSSENVLVGYLRSITLVWKHSEPRGRPNEIFRVPPLPGEVELNKYYILSVCTLIYLYMRATATRVIRMTSCGETCPIYWSS